MKSRRIENLGRVDRSRPIQLTFDGRKIHGFAGDTIASALLANGVDIVGRSFKYHRPRGIWGAGVEEPNAIVDVSGSKSIRNCRATTENALDGMLVRSVNASPTAAADRHAFIDRFSRFLPSGFYYKTFMWPDWHLFEPRIRDMAGLSVIDRLVDGPSVAEQINESCDLLVVGGGPAGLFAALAAARAGKSIILCDDGQEFGGTLLYKQALIDGMEGSAWLAQVLRELRECGARLLACTTAFGIYDHGLVALNERRENDLPDRLWRLRPQSIILATGAIERPLSFANNDLPGILSANAGLAYLHRYGVAIGSKVVVATNNGHAKDVADALSAAGSDVTVVDYRKGRRLEGAFGKTSVNAVRLDNGVLVEADAVLVSGGFTPTLHLYCQARGKLRWDDRLLTFTMGEPVEGLFVAGAAAGRFDLAGVLDSARQALASIGIQCKLPATLSDGVDDTIVAAWPQPKSRGRIWIDLQHDVTARDIELAARENFTSVEHLKRYTTLGMATDQGKTSNLNGLALMAQLTGQSIPDVGTTTYRPPFTPVPFTSLAGMRGGSLMNPLRRLALENQHRADHATFREYGGWLRPAWYGRDAEEASVQREARKARETVALFDGSSLGKIEVQGPEAAAFLDFVYYNSMSTLKPGFCRYGFILSESGIVYDDGVLVRLEDDRFIVSCSSSHVSGVYTLLEEWRQDRFDRNRLFIHNATAATVTLTISGPRSRALLETIDLGLPLDDDALPHMATAWGRFGSDPVRVTRVSFTGDRSYELSIRSDRAGPLWSRLKKEGHELDAVLLGLEALTVLRAEKGFIIIGKDSDGMTRPMDLGVSAPLTKKTSEYVGKRSLFTQEAGKPDRRQLVGLELVDGDRPLATGSHAVEAAASGIRSMGYVTSSYFSPNLNRPIALALIERGASRHGEIIEIQNLGLRQRARITKTCAFDPKGERLSG
jgi:sarcosine oxidase, subunit alpha